MRKSLLLLLTLIPLSVNAEPYWAQKPVQCSTREEAIAYAARFDEVPVVVLSGLVMSQNGVGYNAQYILAGNEETQTWTLIEMSTEEQACVLAQGKGYNLVIDMGIKTGYK